MAAFDDNSKILKERYPKFSDLNFTLAAKKNNSVTESQSSSLVQLLEKHSKSRKLIFVKGIDSAAILKNLVSYFDSAEAEFVVIEPSTDRLCRVLSEEDIQPWLNHPRIHWWIQRSPEEFFADAYDFLRTPSRLFHMTSALFVSGASLEESDIQYFVEVEDEWLACQKQRMRSLGGIEDSRCGFLNVVKNKNFIERSPGIDLLKGKFSNVPAIVVATGPSLRKSLPLLKELQDKVLLIAADASLKILIDANITPHFVCSIERDEGPKSFFDSIDARQSNLVAFPLVPSSVLEAFNGPQWVAYRDYGYFFYMNHELPKGILSSSSSVAHMCLRLAQYLDCSNIALVGQDLAYDPKTLQSHPEGIAVADWSSTRSLEEIQKKAAAENLGDVFFVEGNLETSVPTNSVYFSFMKEFSWELSQGRSSVTNCTDGGAKIPNMLWKSLTEWAHGLPSQQDLFLRIQEARKEFKPGSLTFKSIREFLQELNNRWSELIPLLKALPSQSIDPKQRAEIYKTLRKSEQKMLDDVRYITIVVQNAGREYLEAVNEIELLEVEGRDQTPEYQTRVSDLYEIITRVTMQLLNCF